MVITTSLASHVPPPLPPPMSGRNLRDQLKIFFKEKRVAGCPSFFWYFASLTVQVPCFLLWITTIRRMSLHHHEGFDCSSKFHHELPSGVLGPIFPLLIDGLHYITVQYYKKYLEVLTLPILLFTFNLPQLLLKENQMEIEDADLLTQWAGVACIRQGKMGEGLVHLERIATLKEPDDPKSKAHYYEGLVLLSSALINVGRNNDAINYLQMATAYDESYREFLQQCEDMTRDLVTSRRGDY